MEAASVPGPVKGSPTSVAAGRRGAERRWGPPRVIRLDELAPEQRAFILELVEVAKRNAARAKDGGQAA